MNDILVSNGFLSVPAASGGGRCSDASVATVVSNIAARGRVPGRDALEAIRALSEDGLRAWWPAVSDTLDRLTGADRRMETAVVYRNFPREVVEMDRVGYVLRQIAIYCGMPYDLARDDAEEREAAPLGDLSKLSVLALARPDTLARIEAALLAQPSRWTERQQSWALELRPRGRAVDLSDFAFKENGVAVAVWAFTEAGDPALSVGPATDPTPIAVSSATDVLRIAAALSDGDVSLRKPPRLRKFTKAERRRLLAALEGTPNLADDLVARPGPFKRLLERLHPGDWRGRFPRTVEAYDGLYKGAVKPFSARIDPQVPTSDMLDAAVERPGVFLREFHRLYGLFGSEAFQRLLPLLEGLPTSRLLEFKAYLWTIRNRKTLVSPPRGDWSKLQVRENRKVPIDDIEFLCLVGEVDGILRERVRSAFPEGFKLDPRLADVKIRSNAQKLAAHGAGTRFPFPEESSYVRSASYWRIGGHGNVWFDVGWNLFDADWNHMGAVTWDSERFPAIADEPGGVFSGDPAIADVEDRRACQMVDLYPERLVSQGVRYALWGVLAYSGIPFSEADDVLATLSFGDEPQKGGLYDPARAQFVFPLRSPTKRSYVAYLDLAERQTVFMDLELPANLHSATTNGEHLGKYMPAVVDWLAARPSVADLVDASHAEGEREGTIPALYDDAGMSIEGGRAFVFRPCNDANSFDRITVDDLLAAGPARD